MRDMSKELLGQARRVVEVPFQDGVLRFMEPTGAGAIRARSNYIESVGQEGADNFEALTRLIAITWVDDNDQLVLGDDYLDILSGMGVRTFTILANGAGEAVIGRAEGNSQTDTSD